MNYTMMYTERKGYYIMKSAVIGFPRIGKLRELKFATEKYFKKEISEKELEESAEKLRQEHFRYQKDAGIDYISSNDFSFYDQMLDTVVMLDAVPERYTGLGLSDLDVYFAMARGYQGENGDVKAFAMKKWFNTNYHYIVPELYDDTQFGLNSTKLLEEYQEALDAGIVTKPDVIGPFTFLKLARLDGNRKKKIADYAEGITSAYIRLLDEAGKKGVSLIQFDEPVLVTDLSSEDVTVFKQIYSSLLKEKANVRVLLQTYFGDVRDCYDEIMELPFDAVGLDFREGRKNLGLVKEKGFPQDRLLFAGIINGKNIWKCDYKAALSLISEITQAVKTEQVVINTSCSLLHVPYTLDNETELSEDIKEHFSFAKEKMNELHELSYLADIAGKGDVTEEKAFVSNQRIHDIRRTSGDSEIQSRVKALGESDFVRKPDRKEREKIQKAEFGFPVLPTTTIGSFPQTAEVKKNRSDYRKGIISKEQYDKNVFEHIKKCIGFQESIGLDVLVHGEYERNDMVEFFGDNLDGYVFTDKAWVQSYGTRCVKPPIIYGDVRRTRSITALYSKYAQSLTEKPVKGMLTGPVTILNWSFPREDVSLETMAFQIGLAIKEEVMELEASGIKIIQIDEAALKEKLPLRRADWHSEYLEWAIRAFRLCTSTVKPETQIHTHMCYSEFNEIVKDIDNMDADVITFEASRSNLTILDALQACGFETEVGPGVYDIHSPRVPCVSEIVDEIHSIRKKVATEKLWINPDCGLKTRGIPETEASLKNLVEAAKIVRKEIEEEK